MRLLFTLLFIGSWILNLSATESKRIASFSGKIKTGLDSTRLYVSFTNAYTDGSISQRSTFFIKPDKLGQFKFKIPINSFPCHVFIQEMVSSAQLFNFQIVEAGDKIRMDISVNGEGYIDNASYSGEGAGKYNCYRMLNSPSNRRIRFRKEMDLSTCLNAADSAIRNRIKIIDSFRAYINPIVQEIMKADVAGTILNKFLLERIGLSSIYENEQQDSSASKSQANYKIFLDNLAKKYTFEDTVVASTTDYLSFLYQKEKLETFLDLKNDEYKLPDLFNRIKAGYKGLLREKLLVYTLHQTSDITVFFGGCDGNTFTTLANDALSLTENPFLRERLERLIETRGAGARLYEFSLAKDSTSNRVKASDLAGKILLIDIWGYQCTACHLFSKIFHEKVFSRFKSDTMFRVVSIMLDDSGKDLYLKRLRQENGTTYTYPDYTNLFAGAGETNRKKIIDYYGVDQLPFVLLVDKKGEIISSTAPFFVTEDSPNIEKLANLIKAVLEH